MLELVIETPVGHGSKQRGVGRRIEHMLHVDMVEWVVAQVAALDRLDDLRLDGGGSPVEEGLLIDLVHWLTRLS